jgi:hypothetical protein
MKDKENSSDIPEAPRRFSMFSRSLAKSIEQVVKPVYKKHGFAEHRILTQWHEVVGAELAAYSIPQKLVFPRGKKENGTLHILVASARALELQHIQPVIHDKIAVYFGYPAVSRIVFTQSSGAIFQKKRKSKTKPVPVLDAGVSAAVAQCKDEELRGALLSLGNALATVEK